jgi:cyanophycin synthetase
MAMDDIKIESINILRGPNIYAYMPVMHVVMDIGPYEQHPSSEFDGMVDRLLGWLPGLQTHECSVGRPGGFVERLQRGTYLPHITEHLTLELQKQIGFPVTYGRARGTGRRGVYNVVIAFKEEEPARQAFECALRLTLAAMHDEPFDMATELERLSVVADRYRLGPSTGAIVEAARRRNIPVLRLTPRGSLVQLGWGVHQKRIRASETSLTSAIAVDMCQEKPLTNKMLSMVGVPVPAGRSVQTADEAWEVARSLRGPVVVKPEAGNQGKGVSVNLTTEEEVRAAYEIARSFRGDVLVERFIEGSDYRLLVVNGKMVAAARRDPAQVYGDGVRSIKELVAEVNRDPRRRDGHSSILTRIRLDEATRLTLDQQGLTLDSVPESGRIVFLRTNGNLSTGGTATDVTDEVLPANARVAELAAQIMALDIAGIDVLCTDIARPIAEQDGAIVEVNAAPGLRMHLEPTSGKPRQVGYAIVDIMYPDSAPSRIPVIAITGTNGKTTVTRLIAHMYETAHWITGTTTSEGIYIDRERVVHGDCSGPQSARTVLLHPRVEVAVLETARGGILREGLAFPCCRVGVVTNVSRDHMGLKGVDTIQDLARVKQVVIESVERTGAAVLNADDPLVAEMAAATDAEVVYFARSMSNHILQAHRSSGGRCVSVQDGRVYLVQGRDMTELIELDRLGFAAEGRIPFQVQNALAATAAAWAAGLNPAMIARGLSTFRTDSDAVPGRFNVLERGGIEVIVDYAHNREAMRSLGEGVCALGSKRTVLLLTLPGDRMDDDLRATLEATLSFADEYVLYDNHGRRGRQAGEIPELLASYLGDRRPLEIAPNMREGLRRALTRVSRGDRLVLIAEYADEALQLIDGLEALIGQEASCTAPISAAY